jgi:hypothetical protein
MLGASQGSSQTRTHIARTDNCDLHFASPCDGVVDGRI